MKTVTQHQRTNKPDRLETRAAQSSPKISPKPEESADGVHRTSTEAEMKRRQTVASSGENCWVTDDKEEAEFGTDSGQERPKEKREQMPSWWKLMLQSLPRFRVRGEQQWQVGKRVLVMTGKPGLDEGQVAVVTEQKRCMVEIAFRGPDGTVRRKAKHAGSLIGL